MPKIGFIGLGTMGRPMAEHLVKAGHDVRINRVKAASEYLTELGARAAATPGEAVDGAEFVILMLPDTPDVEGVLFGEGGIADRIAPGSLVIDMSSIAPVATKDFARRIRERGAHYLDAPVSGGEIGARNASLSIMVGGDADQFQRALPIFQTMGKNITHVGENGAGQVAKVANQIIVGLTIECVGEAFLLAQRAGVDVSRVREALLGGFAHSRILEVHGQRMIEGNFDPGFALRLHRKDLNLAMDTARALQIALPNTSATTQLMNAALARGDGDRDHSALYRTLAAVSAPAANHTRSGKTNLTDL